RAHGACSLEAVEDPDDVAELKELIEKHQTYTASSVAQNILDNWDQCLPKFVQVMPTDYKRALDELKAAAAAEAAGESVIIRAPTTAPG
ncbi:MAG: hypothetical protein DWQ29_20275, partial [Planctomycetota bacterium]